MNDDEVWTSPAFTPAERVELPAGLRYEELLEEGTQAALQTIYDVMTGDDKKEALKAATVWLDRAKGRPAQAMEVTGKDGGAIMQNVVVEFVPVVKRLVDEQGDTDT